MKDERCKFCDVSIRWCTTANDPHRIALDLAPVPDSGKYSVCGADTAMYVKVADRPKYAKLYRPHKETCANRDDANAFIESKRREREERPANVVRLSR